MGEIKTDLFPEALRGSKNKEGKKGENRQGGSQKNVVTFTEPLPESSRPRKDGPGGE